MIPLLVVGVGFVCQGLGPLDGGDPDRLVLRLPGRPPEEEVQDGLVEAFPLGGGVPEGLDGPGQFSCRPYQPQTGVQGPALEGCVEELGVAHGSRCVGGVLWVSGGLAGWAVEVWHICVNVCAFHAGCGWRWREAGGSWVSRVLVVGVPVVTVLAGSAGGVLVAP